VSSDIFLLCGTAASVAVIHTIIGPDHYLPFVAMGRARRWPLSKTAWVTFLCGIGHVASSFLIGLVGVLLAIGVLRLEALEAFRGTLTAWLLIGFGCAYFVWGVHRAIRNRPHRHLHRHGDVLHEHVHTHAADHAHVHEARSGDLTPWVLFILFVLGPCEALIPILMYPAAQSSLSGMLLVSGVFGVTTVATMVGVVMLSAWGLGFANLGRLERYSHAAAGAVIFLSGLAIQVLGL
jgi:ABC-type nickel/cobalt efflux system permease component RcnA